MKYSANEIEKIIGDNEPVLVHLNLRTPMYGKLVAIADHDELIKKGFVRFVIGDRLALFEGNSFEDEEKRQEGSVNLTKILGVRQITYIKQC